MTTLSFRGAATLAAVAGALAVGAPVASSAGIDPAVYDPGLAPGQVEHGVVDFTISGSAGNDMHRRTEYWVSEDRWREQTTDAKTGELLSGRVHDSGGTTWLQYKPVNGDPRVTHFSGNDSVPGAGYPAPFNQKLATTGVLEGNATRQLNVTLQPIGAVTIAGFTGTRYEVLSNGQPGIEDAAGSHSILVIEDGTYKPLLRESTAPNGKFGQFDQREELVSRTISSSDAAVARVSKASFKKTVRAWKAKVKAFKASKQRHKK
ncbi:MAG TPA: hypothetical protein VI318_26115 [Baekduia sp.]